MRVILVGDNRTVYYLARRFVSRRYHVTAIVKDSAFGHELFENTKATVINGDGTDLPRLEEAGARQADVLIALTALDQDNLIACQIANHSLGVPRTIALVNDPDNEEVFKKLGVTETISATRLIGSIIDQETTFEDVTGLMSIANGRVNISDVHLAEDSPAVGKTLQQLQLPGNSLVGSIIRNERVIVPRGDTRLEAHDHLILISEPDQQSRDLAVLCGP
jgi:trk system potassium uptake protein TrkA